MPLPVAVAPFAPVLLAIVPPEPAEPVPATTRPPLVPVLSRMMPVAEPPLEAMLVKLRFAAPMVALVTARAVPVDAAIAPPPLATRMPAEPVKRPEPEMLTPDVPTTFSEVGAESTLTLDMTMPAAPTGLPDAPTAIAPPLTVWKPAAAPESNVARVMSMPSPKVLPSTVTFDNPVMVRFALPPPFQTMPLPALETTEPFVNDTKAGEVVATAKPVLTELMEVLLTLTVVEVPPGVRTSMPLNEATRALSWIDALIVAPGDAPLLRTITPSLPWSSRPATSAVAATWMSAAAELVLKNFGLLPAETRL